MSVCHRRGGTTGEREKLPTRKRAVWEAAVSGMVLTCVAIRVWDGLCDKEGIPIQRSIAKGETLGLTRRATSLSVFGSDGLGISCPFPSSIQVPAAAH